MSSCKGIGFRGLKKSFFNVLKEGELRPILGFEKKHRGTFLVEIRKNYLDLYFLGHAIKVAQTRSGYNLSSAKVFLPDKVEKWPISFNDIKKKYKDYNRKEYKSQFDEFMSEIMLEIVRHKKGDISEGVSEMNHYINNRVAYKPGDIVVIDRQVTHGKARIDLLGLKRLKSGDFSFVVIELKNKENKDIEEVFSQANEYLNIIREHYDSFQATYNLILEQKIKLGLLDKKNNGKIADRTSGEGLIEGIVILDNYKLRSELLERALKNDWGKFRNSHNIKLFLKTNTLDNRFLWNYEKTNKFIKKCS